MVISDSAVIVIVLVASLFLTALCAALFRHYNPTGDDCKAYERNLEQSKYMRAVRLRNYGFLKRESMSAAKDLESRYNNSEVASAFYQYGQDAATPSGYGHESSYMQDDGYSGYVPDPNSKEPAHHVREATTPSTNFG